jgi:hypothetical protein
MANTWSSSFGRISAATTRPTSTAVSRELLSALQPDPVVTLTEALKHGKNRQHWLDGWSALEDEMRALLQPLVE